ncbi:MAG: efflux RND transporter permease subunit, partial [Gemmatimonadales bacterium]
LLPSVSYPQLVVYTRYPDVGPSEVERFVTERIERVVSRVAGVERVESVSREGISLVTLRFSWGTDMDFAALNVREQLDNIREELPELAARPTVLRTDPGSEPIIVLSVSGGTDLATLKELTESVFKRRLEQIDGIAEAALAGGLEREIHVEIDARLLESYGFTVDDIARTLDGANQSAPGGTIRRGRYRYALRTLGEFQTVEEIGGVPLGAATGGGNLVLLRDVATIDDGFKDRESVARFNGDESVGVLLFKESGANTVRVTERVEDVLDQLRLQYPDVRLDVAMAQAGFISDAINNVVQALVVGGVLAFLVLFLFLRDARYPVAIALAIPISVVGTFALLDLANVSLNIMSLGGLALGVGMLVDNSIVVLENIFRHRQEGMDVLEAAARGAEEVQGAITASTLTTISVFGPIIYVEGVAGELFGALSFAVAFALVVSLAVAITLLPTMAARWRGDPEAVAATFIGRALGSVARAVGGLLGALFRPVLDRFDRVFGVFAEWYHGVLERALDRRGRVIGIAMVTLAAGVLLALTLERDVLPDVDQGAFTIRLELPRGTPIEATTDAAARIEAVFLADDDVASVFSRVGRQDAIAGVENEESGLNTAVIEVRLADGARTREVVERTRPQLASFPPGAIAIQTGTATALGRLLGGTDADLSIRVRGDDLDQIWNFARLVEQRLQSVASLANVRLGTDEGQPEILVEIARERAAAYGIEPRLIAQTVEQYMRGIVATQYVDFNEKVPVLVRLPERERRSLETLQTLSVSGVPLRELVDTREVLGPVEIRRLDQGRVVEIFADVASGGLDGAVADVRRVLAEQSPPRGVRVEIGGANEERDRSFRDLAFAFGLALLLVYMILAAQFESFIHPFTILLSVPLATVGASVALFLAGEGLNTMSLIGIVILVGIVVNDAIVKVDFINQMRAQGMALRVAILAAGRVRLRPIVMTTLTTVLGLTPMALGFGRGADLRAPLAVAVIGGLLSATALTLVVVPVAYDLLEDARGRLRNIFGLGAAETAAPARVAR